MTFDPDRRAPHDRIAFIVTASWWGSACTLLYGLATNRWTAFTFRTGARCSLTRGWSRPRPARTRSVRTL